MIDGVMTKRLKVVPDDRGRLMECLRNDDELFIGFGQFYMTTTLPGVVKGWHLHDVQWDNIVCVKGTLKLALFDGRGVQGEAAAPGFERSATAGQIDQFYLGEHNPLLVRVPPGVWHGWKCVGVDEAYIVNAPTEVYRYDAPDQRELPHDTAHIAYDWGVRLR